MVRRRHLTDPRSQKDMPTIGTIGRSGVTQWAAKGAQSTAMVRRGFCVPIWPQTWWGCRFCDRGLDVERLHERRDRAPLDLWACRIAIGGCIDRLADHRADVNGDLRADV
jgi:hypothetical protein